jgi:ATP-dependent DNA helicase RecG
VDLNLRGPGDILGTQQSGILNLQIADLVKDKDILQLARFEAIQILKSDPYLQDPMHENLKLTYQKLTQKKNIWNYIS